MRWLYGGSGTPLREFLHVDDLADAVVFLLENYSDLEHANVGNGKEVSIKELAELVKDVVGLKRELEHVNVGNGKEVSIKELAELVKEVVGFKGELVWDTSKPDGTPRKLMDSSKISGLGWTPRISLRDGLVVTYKWYVENYGKQ
ncbi:hypothetical protein CQW23_16253 [Capsicum baccatum]|uniref:NAD-dependent epimerase/dehydratase domain-containing protein n=1 Tax=Capsicum baccatum TaxID=33114 RepID=A0A2G2WAF4_CAPBA|nr:hypothetical protein CQW23_16253 [Capsicum baccatum]